MQKDSRSAGVFSAKSLTATSSERFSESRYFLSKEPDNTGVQKDSQRAGIFSAKPLTAASADCFSKSRYFLSKAPDSYKRRKILRVQVFSQ
ncbi:MAG: hypothetical protein IJS39_03055 [Synergistaceae bacterium]|nr:hypothetical protein [Synergistaceae bacterium]